MGKEPTRTKQQAIPLIRPTLVDFAEVEEAFREVWNSGLVTVGKYTAQFEEAVKETLGVKHAVALSSCTSGLILAIKALGLTGEVIVPSFTFTATVHALVWNGVKPVFCDCQPDTFNMDPERVKDLITADTSALMPVYTFGVPPDVDELEEIAQSANLRIVLDAAQGLGSSYRGRMAGGFGDVEVFSLSPTKVVSSIEGGLVTTNDAEIARTVRSMRDYGKSSDGEDIDFIGLSARISEFHSIVGLKNLGRIKELIHARHRLLSLYRENLNGLAGIRFQTIPGDRESTGNYMVIWVSEEESGISRDEVYRKLKREGIETKKYFYPAVHLQRAYEAYRNGYPGRLPITEKAAQEGLALPLYSHMDEETVAKVSGLVRQIVLQAKAGELPGETGNRVRVLRSTGGTHQASGKETQ